MNRNLNQLYPDFTAEIEEIRNNGISEQLLQKIIQKHKGNACYNRSLYKRYMVINDSVPIFDRKPRFDEPNEINNKINNDFFSEIVDFKTGYFAGKPISYGYSKGNESEEVTGGKEAVDKATKAVTDFVTRNNMFGVDMEITKFASIYGYAGRLFYIDTDGNERVMPVHGYETIILSETNISEPEYAIRYFYTTDLNGVKHWTVEFYDNTNIYTYTGYLSALKFVDVKPHLFDYCPLQGIANNNEMLGDCEKVLSLIDDYDKVLSDNSNEVEAFVHAYLIFEGLRIDDKTIEKGQKSGSFVFPATGTQQGKAYFLTKNINDAFTEHHLQRLEDNIYRFSRTPNLTDDTFGAASGVSLKFKLHGLETKCGMFQAKVMDAGQYMWKLLSSVWAKKKITVDPLQVTMDFSRNFPLDLASEAQTVQALISAGLPKEIAYSQLSFIDDVDYVMELIEAEKDNIPSLTENIPEDEETDEETDKKENEKINEEKTEV
ncbi:MAG: phage portal protein [Acutalibacteraceae bacterium]